MGYWSDRSQNYCGYQWRQLSAWWCAFLGKEPIQLHYMARFITKNIVAAELATRCLVQLAYAIGRWSISTAH